MAQLRYGYGSPIGAAGGLVDLSPYAIDTFHNAEDTGVLKFGMGVVNGTNPGADIVIPVEDSTAADFCGITVANRTTEYDVEGNLHIRKSASVGVMQYGRVFARVAEGVTPAYGEAVYLIAEGKEAGCFTNEAAQAEGDDPKTIAIKARFIGSVDSTGKIAAVELFNEARA